MFGEMSERRMRRVSITASACGMSGLIVRSIRSRPVVGPWGGDHPGDPVCHLGNTPGTPPSTVSTHAVVRLASSDRRKATALATSVPVIGTFIRLRCV
jgi:hypothetical protein